jgi:hypothetical protein
VTEGMRPPSATRLRRGDALGARMSFEAGRSLADADPHRFMTNLGSGGSIKQDSSLGDLGLEANGVLPVHELRSQLWRLDGK